MERRREEADGDAQVSDLGNGGAGPFSVIQDTAERGMHRRPAG